MDPQVPGAIGNLPKPNRVAMNAKGEEKIEKFLLIKMIVSRF